MKTRTSPVDRVSACLLSSLLAMAFALAGAPLKAHARGPKPRSILLPAKPSALERLAAREVRRYLYVRTGKLLPIVSGTLDQVASAPSIILGRRDQPLVREVAEAAGVAEAIAALRGDEHCLKRVSVRRRPALLLASGSEVATLYGAYRLAELFGVRFYLHGDVIPDGTVPLSLPEVDETARPLFALRGIQPFHDFPEGPDWWNLEGYQAILSQLPKLRMNFIGLHTYPEGHPNAEPTVWIGLPDDFDHRGRVRFSYPASYQNTLRGNWGYKATPTSRFLFGTSELFERDAFGAEVMWGYCPQPDTPEGCNAVFNRVGDMLRQAFEHAHRLGIRTCVGTETPLTVPKLLKDRLAERNLAVTNWAVIQKLYEGIFARCARAYPLDYYWFWTPEGWTWSGTKPEQIQRTTNDLNAALAAYEKVKPPFRLATCGWVLGPVQDRALFDKVLPKDVAVSCINRQVGNTPVDKAFAEVRGRGKWAIPWMEDDPGLTAPQLWVGRMRRDAADALAYGCDGLMGIHWRTRVLGPAVSALARAAWDQSPWLDELRERRRLPKSGGVVGGKSAAFKDHAIAETDLDPVYQTVRYDVSAYHVPVPTNAPCKVTLRFCEPHYKEAGKRVFGVKIEGRQVIDKLDIFGRVGRDTALDFTFDNILPGDAWLDIEFVKQVEYPSIAGITIQASGWTTNINCGGPAWKDFAADLPSVPALKDIFAPVGDFYQDWAATQFGESVADAVAGIFTRLDCHLPRPAQWVGGPGGIKPDERPWEEVSKEYAFVEELAALRSKVRGPGNLARFDYWLNTFRYMRAMAQVNCTWAQFNRAMKKAKDEKDPVQRRRIAREEALPLREALVRQVEEVHRYLLATVSNTGELGTVANWQQHLLPDLLLKPGQELAKILGPEVSPYMYPIAEYRGPLRVIVPTVQTALPPGQPLRLKVIVLAETAPREAWVYARALGRGKYTRKPLQHVARGVYRVELPAPANGEDDLEYYLEVVPQRGKPVYFPATAPKRAQTVVIMPEGSQG